MNSKYVILIIGIILTVSVIAYVAIGLWFNIFDIASFYFVSGLILVLAILLSLLCLFGWFAKNIMEG